MHHRKLQFTLVLTTALIFASCTGTAYDTQTAGLRSCYDTGFGLKCVSTPGSLETTARDVNDDGVIDAFVCGDTPSASDSDDDESGGGDDSDDGSTAEDDDGDESGDADSASDSEDNSESDEDCGVSVEDGESDGSSESDLDGDGDGDGVSDGTDCDCL